MKKLLIILTLIFIIPAVSITAFSADVSDTEKEQLESTGINDIVDGLDEQTKEILQKAGIDEITSDAVFDVSLSGFFKAFADIFNEAGREPFKVLLILVGTTFLGSFTGGVSNSFGKKISSSVFDICMGLFTMLVVIKPLSKCISAVGSAIVSASDLMLLIIPVLCVLLASSGKVSTAVGFNGLSVALAEIISTLCSSVAMPACNIMLGTSLIGAINQDIPINTMIASVRKYMSVIIGIFSSIYFSVLGIKSNIGSSVDSVGLKATKLLVGNFIPVIGGAVSDSINTVTAYVGLTKNVVGAAAILIVTAMFMPVCIQTLLWLAVFHCAGFTAGMMGQKVMENMFKTIASIITVLLVIIVFIILLFVVNTGMIMLVKGNL